MSLIISNHYSPLLKKALKLYTPGKEKKRVQFATLLYQSHLTWKYWPNHSTIQVSLLRSLLQGRLGVLAGGGGTGLTVLVCTGLEATEVHRLGEAFWLSVTERSAAICLCRLLAGRLVGSRHSWRQDGRCGSWEASMTWIQGPGRGRAYKLQLEAFFPEWRRIWFLPRRLFMEKNFGRRCLFYLSSLLMSEL